MRVPTKKLEQLADQQQFKPATRRFFPSIYRKAKDYNVPFVVDFHAINREIAKTKGREYSRPALNYVREQIINSPVIKVVRRYAPYVLELKITPFLDEHEIKEDENFDTRPDAAEKSQDASPEPDMELLSEDAGIDQQQLIQVNRELLAEGIKYDRYSLPLIARYGVDAVKKSLTLFKRSKLTNHIPNPEGWIRRCLERGWYRKIRENQEENSLWMLSKLEQFTNLVISEFGTLPSEVINKIKTLIDLGLYPLNS